MMQRETQSGSFFVEVFSIVKKTEEPVLIQEDRPSIMASMGGVRKLLLDCFMQSFLFSVFLIVGLLYLMSGNKNK